MRTSSNCLSKKKQDAMHCLPGMVSETKATRINHSIMLVSICYILCDVFNYQGLKRRRVKKEENLNQKGGNFANLVNRKHISQVSIKT